MVSTKLRDGKFYLVNGKLAKVVSIDKQDND